MSWSSELQYEKLVPATTMLLLYQYWFSSSYVVSQSRELNRQKTLKCRFGFLTQVTARRMNVGVSTREAAKEAAGSRGDNHRSGSSCLLGLLSHMASLHPQNLSKIVQWFCLLCLREGFDESDLGLLKKKKNLIGYMHTLSIVSL